ncbi:C-C motif chemokine 27a [Anarrhichthys ocellatus]|uniref:C-C motif chemokine 27a n=1 Tax=Anarrhichthys ocellatus TaxID=433405 RepID=UPI0012ED8EFE|nr:C-C motif chemokine 25-like [Anarrhichthys ocellatus]
MELKVAFVTVCLCALAITSTEAGIPKCCIATKQDIPARMLRKVQGWSMQHSSGACDIPALILRVKDMRRPVCAHPKVKRALMMLQWRMKQNKQKAAY